MRPPTPSDEAERLRALYELRVLDTPPEPDFDDLAALASGICHTPAALINLVDADRQWSKARLGLDEGEIPRELSFCAHAILGNDVLVVPDATADPRFTDNPFVARRRGIRFYAGAPLITSAGQALGALCVIDVTPRRLARPQVKALRALSRQVVILLELRPFAGLLTRGAARLREIERYVDDVGQVVGRWREPLGRLRASLATPGNPRLPDTLLANAGLLRRIVDDLLALVARLPPAGLGQREVDLSPLTQRAAESVRPIADAKRIPVLCTTVTPTPVHADPVRLEQALSHLLFHAVKRTPDGGRLEVFSGLESEPTIRIRSPGTVVDDRPDLLRHFYEEALVRPPDTTGAEPGLRTVKAVFDAHRASMALYDRPGDGTSLHLVFPAARG
ncbi:GAF domain-containing sensor histidine kinase [Planosporangium thailandense]|uniref:GAF domain-containing sensor histidine kinase n=1 Tax=Planosporangium thailandense TaxID=765197 RepID=A0ABX0Y6G9_9ACTN|nr:GAF domain-containing sensor histidine kinase [Planosporangium thailandense]NJC74011.1 GAF domain-containing sensor histidine kinase [Planosporangium thailandense]